MIIGAASVVNDYNYFPIVWIVLSVLELADFF